MTRARRPHRRGARAAGRATRQIESSRRSRNHRKPSRCIWRVCACGAVFVPLNTAYTTAEIEYFLGDADPKIAVGVASGGISLAELARNERGLGAARLQTAKQSDLAALLYTSGTTGRSKGAMLTRANLATNAITLAQAWRFTATRRAAARPADLPRAWPVRRDQHRARVRQLHAVPAEVRCRRSRAAAAGSDGDDGRADVLHAAAAASRFHARSSREHPPVRVRVRAAARGNASRVSRAHRPRDSRTLRHERDAHEHVQSLRRRARCRLGRPGAARRAKFASPIPSPARHCPKRRRSA